MASDSTFLWFLARLTGSQQRLADFARTSSTVAGRQLTAIRLLRDPTVLLEIASSNNSPKVRETAATTLASRLLSSRRPDGALLFASLLGEFRESLSRVANDAGVKTATQHLTARSASRRSLCLLLLPTVAQRNVALLLDAAQVLCAYKSVLAPDKTKALRLCTLADRSVHNGRNALFVDKEELYGLPDGSLLHLSRRGQTYSGMDWGDLGSLDKDKTTSERQPMDRDTIVFSGDPAMADKIATEILDHLKPEIDSAPPESVEAFRRSGS